MSVMTSPIKIMRKFMQKPWPLFSCSPQCGIVNWVYVSKSGKMFPINRFVNFDRFFNSIRKTAESANPKEKCPCSPRCLWLQCSLWTCF